MGARPQPDNPLAAFDHAGWRLGGFVAVKGAEFTGRNKPARRSGGRGFAFPAPHSTANGFMPTGEYRPLRPRFRPIDYRAGRKLQSLKLSQSGQSRLATNGEPGHGRGLAVLTTCHIGPIAPHPTNRGAVVGKFFGLCRYRSAGKCYFQPVRRGLGQRSSPVYRRFDLWTKPKNLGFRCHGTVMMGPGDKFGAVKRVLVEQA